MREGTVTLPDGRKLGYAEYGGPTGPTVLEFHGLPGGRFHRREAEALREVGARSLTVERPGFGLSDPKPGRTLADWPADVAAFADALGIEEFAVAGASAGAPYALQTALALSDRVRCVGLICGVGPAFEHPEHDEGFGPQVSALMPLARADRQATVPRVHEVFGKQREEWLADHDAFFEQWLTGWSEQAQHLIRAFEDQWKGNLETTYRTEGTFADDVLIVFGPWGIDLSAMPVPLRAWHGTEDEVAPIGLAEVVVKEAGGELVRYKGEGHYLRPVHQVDWLRWLIDPL